MKIPEVLRETGVREALAGACLVFSGIVIDRLLDTDVATIPGMVAGSLVVLHGVYRAGQETEREVVLDFLTEKWEIEHGPTGPKSENQIFF